MKAQDLKKSILQYAMQGKLVMQDPNDEPASELLKRIKVEKEQLIKEGKIKKEKPLPPITQDEIPYELPQGWEWVRFQDVIDVRDGTHDSPKYQKKGYPFITSKNLSNGVIDFTNANYISKEDYLKFSLRSNVENEDILFAMIGSIGNPVIVKKDRDFSIKNVALFKKSQHIITKYLYFYLYYIQDLLKSNATGAVQSFVSLSTLRLHLFVLPPLTEQKRIVEKLEEILSLVEDYGKNEEILSEMNQKLPKQIRQSILQYAVQGKLIEQNPQDEPASELLKRIKVEKEQLIKEGKIKKEKPLPPITQDEIPYELPQGWEWVRLGEISQIYRGLGPKYESNSNYKFINQKCIKWGSIEHQFCKTVAKESFERFNNDKLIKIYDLLINSTGEGTIGRCSIASQSIVGLGYDSHVLLIRPIICMNSYYQILLNSSIGQNQINEVKGAKTTKQTELGVEKTRTILIPLPPLAEQKRIVAKVDELMKICEELEKENNIVQKLSSELFQSVMQKCFASKVSSNKIIDLKLKRAILSAKIINELYKEKYFGAVKLEKILYLCETHLGVTLHGKYKKEAAGPYDAKSRYEVEDILKIKKWFDVQKITTGSVENTKYLPLENYNEIQTLYNDTFAGSLSKIDKIIDLFKGKNSDFCESIATLYAVWKNRLNNNLTCTNSELISDFKMWSKSKERFYDSDLLDRILFMRRKGLTPDSNIKK